MAIRLGDRVRIRYTGRLEDGTAFDASEADEPFEFVAGSDEIIEGVSHGVVGMEAGEKKTLTLACAQAFGERDPDMEERVPLADLPEDVGEGDRLTATTDDDEEIEVWVRAIEGDEAVVDGNHPLAGNTVIYDVEILSVNSQ